MDPSHLESHDPVLTKSTSGSYNRQATAKWGNPRHPEVILAHSTFLALVWLTPSVSSAIPSRFLSRSQEDIKSASEVDSKLLSKGTKESLGQFAS